MSEIEWDAASVADRYAERKQRYGWASDSPRVIPVGSRVRIDGPLGRFHRRMATVVMSIPRQVVVILDGTHEQIVLGTPAVEVDL